MRPQVAWSEVGWSGTRDIPRDIPRDRRSATGDVVGSWLVGHGRGDGTRSLGEARDRRLPRRLRELCRAARRAVPEAAPHGRRCVRSRDVGRTRSAIMSHYCTHRISTASRVPMRIDEDDSRLLMSTDVRSTALTAAAIGASRVRIGTYARNRFGRKRAPRPAGPAQTFHTC